MKNSFMKWSRVFLLSMGVLSMVTFVSCKDDEDEEFARKLLSNSLNNWEDTEKKLESKLLNWDLERISLMDRIILVAAITELDSFPLTASRIIINEYIDVSKVYGTEKSHIFINGILDKYTKDLDRV